MPRPPPGEDEDIARTRRTEPHPPWEHGGTRLTRPVTVRRCQLVADVALDLARAGLSHNVGGTPMTGGACPAGGPVNGPAYSVVLVVERRPTLDKRHGLLLPRPGRLRGHLYSRGAAAVPDTGRSAYPGRVR